MRKIKRKTVLKIGTAYYKRSTEEESSEIKNSDALPQAKRQSLLDKLICIISLIVKYFNN